MIIIEQTAEELRIVAAAIKLECLAETCNYVDYHPDHGRVKPYWKPMWFVANMIRELK